MFSSKYGYSTRKKASDFTSGVEILFRNVDSKIVFKKNINLIGFSEINYVENIKFMTSVFYQVCELKI